jgi:hypothetical protein
VRCDMSKGSSDRRRTRCSTISSSDSLRPCAAPPHPLPRPDPLESLLSRGLTLTLGKVMDAPGEWPGGPGGWPWPLPLVLSGSSCVGRLLGMRSRLDRLARVDPWREPEMSRLRCEPPRSKCR